MLHVIRVDLNYNNNAYFWIKCMFRTSDIRLKVDVKFKYEHEHEIFNSNKYKMFGSRGVFLMCAVLLLNIGYSICARLCLYIVHGAQ